MATPTSDASSTDAQFDAARRVIDSFEQLLDSTDRTADRLAAEAALDCARALYAPVRELVEQIRLTNGEVPSLRAGLARLDERLGEADEADRRSAA